MKIIKKSECPMTSLPGRDIWKVVGKDSYSPSTKITYGFARFSYELGNPESHHHAEEICYVLNARNAFIHFGPSQESLGELQPLKGGMTLHIPELEWHQFVCQPEGFLEIIFIYGQVDNIRPEEMKKS